MSTTYGTRHKLGLLFVGLKPFSYHTASADAVGQRSKPFDLLLEMDVAFFRRACFDAYSAAL